MIIRQTQIDAFQNQADAEFVKQIAEHLRADYPAAVVRLPTGPVAIEEIMQGTLHEMIRGGITRARGHGLTWESSIVPFVVLMFLTAPNFDEHLPIQSALRDSEVVEDAKLDLLLERTSNRDWVEVDERYEAATWNVPQESELYREF
jgi:hypothetical protein